jgi:hypothetical protein
MLRLIRRAAVAIALLILMTVIAAWIRSYSCWDDIEYRRIVSAGGRGIYRIHTVYSSYGGVSSYGEDRPVIMPLAPSVTRRATQQKDPLWRDGLSHTTGGHSINPRYPIADAGALTTTWYFGHGFQFGNCAYAAQFPYTGNDRVGMRAVVPYWSLALVAAVLPGGAAAGAVMRMLRRRHRRAKRLCLRCGFDLRHSPDRCPECGTPAASLNPAGGPREVAGGRNATMKRSPAGAPASEPPDLAPSTWRHPRLG